MSRSQLHISEVARLVGITPKTIRHYHKLGLVPEPARSDGGYRLYGVDDLRRLQRIKRLQLVGLSLQQIQFILESDDPDALLQTTLHSIRENIDRQLSRLQQSRERIDRYLTEQATLSTIDLPEGVPYTYQQLSSIIGTQMGEVPPEAAAFDLVFLARLEAFDWPQEQLAGLVEIAQLLTSNDQLREAYGLMVRHFLDLAHLAPDAPQIVNAAWEVVQSAGWQRIRQLMVEQTTPQNALQLAMDDFISALSQEMLSPAQLRFLEVLSEMFERMQ